MMADRRWIFCAWQLLVWLSILTCVPSTRALSSIAGDPTAKDSFDHDHSKKKNRTTSRRYQPHAPTPRREPPWLFVVDALLWSNNHTRLETHRLALARRVIHVLHTRLPWQTFLPEKMGATVSRQSAQHDCLWAANGGPFHADHAPCGTTIVNHTLRSVGDDRSVGWGYDPLRHAWVIGTLTNLTTYNDAGDPPPSSPLESFVTGMGWLVREGQNVAQEDSAEDEDHRAPRTALGVTKDGAMMVVVADGCEHCLVGDRGPTLNELADFMIHKLHVAFAVAMDGGSSSVLVRHRKERKDGQDTVVSRPTCLDVLPWPCEAAVTTISCWMSWPDDGSHVGSSLKTRADEK